MKHNCGCGSLNFEIEVCWNIRKRPEDPDKILHMTCSECGKRKMWDHKFQYIVTEGDGRYPEEGIGETPQSRFLKSEKEREEGG